MLVELNARVVRQDRGIEETFDRAYRMLTMRRVLVRTGTGYLVLPTRPAAGELLRQQHRAPAGAFEAGVRARDALPALSAVVVTADPDGWGRAGRRSLPRSAVNRKPCTETIDAGSLDARRLRLSYESVLVPPHPGDP